MRRKFVPLTLAAAIAGCAPPPIAPPPSAGPSTFASTILAVHNRERAAFGAAPLIWDSALAAGAEAYARQLAVLGALRHAPRRARPGQGENLWMGSRGAYSAEAMAGAWASEKTRFRSGLFPSVSTTGNWADVGHYSQMIWPPTTQLGCSLASSARWDFLVCRYAPAGNVDGVRPAPR